MRRLWGGSSARNPNVVRIEPDVGRNRVLIILSGSPTGEKYPQAEKDLKDALARLRSPVDVMSDIRELEALDEHLVEQFKMLGLLLAQFGVRRVVRVVGRSAKAAVHMERLSRNLKNHAAHLAFSMQEAEQVFSK